ncbi:MAG: hypothetical protein AVDCRST_MAG16-3182, partial [uncultured Frankineae bacterium]
EPAGRARRGGGQPAGHAGPDAATRQPAATGDRRARAAATRPARTGRWAARRARHCHRRLRRSRRQRARRRRRPRRLHRPGIGPAGRDREVRRRAGGARPRRVGAGHAGRGDGLGGPLLRPAARPEPHRPRGRLAQADHLHPGRRDGGRRAGDRDRHRDLQRSGLLPRRRRRVARVARQAEGLQQPCLHRVDRRPDRRAPDRELHEHRDPDRRRAVASLHRDGREL